MFFKPNSTFKGLRERNDMRSNRYGDYFELFDEIGRNPRPSAKYSLDCGIDIKKRMLVFFREKESYTFWYSAMSVGQF